MGVGPMQHVLIFGAGGGIGGAMIDQLLARPTTRHITAVSRAGSKLRDYPNVTGLTGDITQEADLQRIAQTLETADPPDTIIIATGLLHREGDVAPEKSYRVIEAAMMAEVLAVNLIGPALVAKHLMPLLPKDRRTIFAALSARVGSISDNRLGGWHSYRAAKAGLNMFLRNLAIEMARTHPLAIIAGLHPGTVDTRLSAPFQRGVAPAKLFTPAQSAAALLDVLDRLAPADSGGVFAWDGERIPA